MGRNADQDLGQEPAREPGGQVFGPEVDADPACPRHVGPVVDENAGAFRAGVEYVGQDLEETFRDAAEGGARHFLGPIASVQHDAFTVPPPNSNGNGEADRRGLIPSPPAGDRIVPGGRQDGGGRGLG